MCGYCEPGFIMAIAALLQASPNPSAEQIDALPNLCRCGAYPRIRKAIARAAQAMGGAAPIARAVRCPPDLARPAPSPEQAPAGDPRPLPQPVVPEADRFSGG